MAGGSKASLFLVFLTVFIDLLGFGIVMPLLPRYGKHFQLEGYQLGLLMSCFSAMQFLAAPVWGHISDRIGRRPVLLVGLAGSAISYTLFGYVTSLGATGTLLGLSIVPWLFITRSAAGVAGATIPTAQAYIADITGPEKRGMGMAMIGAAFGLGFTFGPVLGAMFIPAGTGETIQPSPMPGYVAGILSGVAFLLAWRLLAESWHPGAAPAHGKHPWGGFATLGKNPSIALLMFTMFLTIFAFGQFENTLSLLTESLHLTDRQNFMVFAYIGLILFLSQGLFVRPLLPRLGEKNLAMFGTILMAIGLLGIGFSVQRGWTAMQLWVLLPFITIGFACLNPALQSILSRSAAGNVQGEILGMGQSVSALARILGPVSGTTLLKVRTDLPYVVGGGLMVLGVLLVLLLKQPTNDKVMSSTSSMPH